MLLQRDRTDKALWVNPQWNGSDAATFACVIGVSAYEYLDNSDAEYNLSQLKASALTAHKFFRWLANDYHCEGKPLAKCWLLLSPTAAERAVDTSMPETTVPRLDACKQAVYALYDTIKALHPLRVRDSRALFFFSGHGLEMEENRQILLPTDYHPSISVHEAMNSYNIVTGFWKLPLAEQVFFFDACRNDDKRLRGENPHGAKWFNTVLPSERSDDGQSVVVYAAGPGGQAWEPDDPGQGASVFGRVLEDALTGAPGMDRDCADGRCWVTLPEIVKFMKSRVRQALLGAGVPVGNRIIQVWEPPVSAEMCEVGAPPSASEEPPGPGGGGEPPPGPSAGPVLFSYMADVAMPAAWTRPAHSGGREALMVSLESELMTNLLWDGRVFDFQNKVWTSLDDPTSPALVGFHRIARTLGRDMYQLDVQMERPGTFWLELNDHLTSERAACMLPGNGDGLPRYTIDLTFDPRGGAITGFDVILSPANDGLLSTVAKEWKQADEEGTSRDRVDELAGLMAADFLTGRQQSPLAATVTSLVLLRNRRRAGALSAWIGALVEEFPAWPDGYVVCAEQLLSTGLRRPREVVPLLLQLERTGLPRLGESIGLAARQIDALLDVAFNPERERGDEQAEQHRRLQALRERFARVARVFSPHGLCTTLMGAADKVTPGLLDTDDDEFIGRGSLRTGLPPAVSAAVDALRAVQVAVL
jgi:Caspase domain